MLFYVARCDVGPPPDYACTNPPVRPLVLTVPTRSTAGTPFTGQGRRAGAGRDRDARGRRDGERRRRERDDRRRRHRDADAHGAGDATLRATKADTRAGRRARPSARGDAACRRRLRHAATRRCGTADQARVGAITSIREQQRFARRRGAARRCAGTVVADRRACRTFRLRLTRNDRGRCQTFDGARERFVRADALRRARGRWFSVGDRAPTGPTCCRGGSAAGATCSTSRRPTGAGNARRDARARHATGWCSSSDERGRGLLAAARGRGPRRAAASGAGDEPDGHRG